ncbi:mast cell protease 1A [Synchiropus splendidus]|uniref:mast cell protease 1A n=1 Tax=Synchiropus splendidus TaxID=270530 RepID=UPI00237EA3BE|nr:mast cell protease 1A [Synchiropus splendidus]
MVKWKTLLVVLVMAVFLDEHVLAMTIHGGRGASPQSRPYMVLLKRVKDGDVVSHCGGFLLNEYFVLTAAHCKAKSYTAILGLHNYWESHGTQRIPVKVALPFEEYEGGTQHDLMLLQLSAKANFSETIQPITFACQLEKRLPQSCSVAGWGNIKAFSGSSQMYPILQEANVTLVENAFCANGNFYCSGSETGPRQGDSGGPLVCQGEAYGVISQLYRLSVDKPLYTYVKISDHCKWIRCNMKKYH